MLALTLFFACLCTCQSIDYRIVDTAEGPVKGYIDAEGGFFGFYGIPYAKAPTGRDRFKPATPVSKRPYLLEAVDKGIVCPQPTDLWALFKRSFLVTEDCLVANVFVKDTTRTNLPVLVYVHGGGFLIGDGNLLTYKNLLRSKDLVLVTFNYRLGAHGFLCLGTEAAPGNSGMKDQVTLLRWVKENIANFGGNPADVTIAGYSAGAAAVHLLMLSPMSQGLFNKVIPESGAAVGPWSVQTDPIRVAQEYAKMLNFTNYNDLDALEEFYTTVSYEILVSKGMALMNQTNTSISLAPCIEKGAGETFLTSSPINIIKSGNYNKVPMLFGFAKMEGLLRKDVFEYWKGHMNTQFVDFLPSDLDFDEKDTYSKKIREFYFGDKPVDNESIIDYINFITDAVFAYPTLRSVKLQKEAGHNNIYLYEFAYVHEDIPFIPHTDIRGADHCAQTVMIGDGNLTLNDDGAFSLGCRKMKDVMRDLWYNFISEGQPVPDGSELPSWPPVKKDWSPHIILDDTLELGDSLLKDRTLFWDDIYSKFYRHPKPPQRSTHTEL